MTGFVQRAISCIIMITKGRYGHTAHVRSDAYYRRNEALAKQTFAEMSANWGNETPAMALK